MSLRVGTLALGFLVAPSHSKPIPLTNTDSGFFQLKQIERLTLLDLKTRSGTIQHIALTHPSDYWQPTNSPQRATLIAEVPNRFIVFTDEFDSNPGNIQGRCGASGPSFEPIGDPPDHGERYLHVVALGQYPHETLSVLIDSCLMGVTSAKGFLKWKPDKNDVIFGSQPEGKLTLFFEEENNHPVVYDVNPDGSVTRPQPEKKD